MDKSRVAILKTQRDPSMEEIEAKVRQAVDSIGGMQRFVKPGNLVIVKPNLVISLGPETGATTDWRVSKVVADLVKEQGGRPVIGESCGTGGDTEKVFEATGYTPLRDQGYEVVDFKKLEEIDVTVPKAELIKEMKVPDLVTQADVVISVPKIKTHDQLIMTGALKNLKGAIGEKEKNRLHKDGLNQGIADINVYLKPTLTIVDGIIAQQGLGPIFGEPVEMNLIIAGDDLVAVDVIMCRLMEVDPADVPHIGFSEQMGLGTTSLDEVQLIGEPIEEHKRRFKLPDEDLKKIDVPGFTMVFDEKTCTGCRNTMYSVIKDMQTKEMLDSLDGVTAVVGDIETLPDVDPEKLVLVGVCAGKKKREGIRFAPGCAPRNYWVIEAITGTAQQSRGADLRSKTEQ